MIAVWLYSSDGRALYYVAVPLPMPRAVTHAGEVFRWNTDSRRYESSPPLIPLGVGAPPVEVTETDSSTRPASPDDVPPEED